MEIEKELAAIFAKRYSIDLLQNPEMKEMKILGKSGIPVRELLHVYFDVKIIFGISIPQDSIVNGHFDKFSNIVDIIEKQLRQQQCKTP